MAFEQLTLITNRAKRNWQYSIRYGCAMQVTHFALGNSGHDPESYVTALTPDPNFDPSPDANNNRYPPDMIAGPLAVTSALDDPYFATVWQCDVPKGTATGVVSSVYLLAKFLWLNPAPLGVPLSDSAKAAFYLNLGIIGPTTTPAPYFIYSMGYFPLSVKTDNEVWTLSCGCQY